MAKDLRSFLSYLETHMAESLSYVDREVDPRFEAVGILSKLEGDGRYPAVIFRKIKGSRLSAICTQTQRDYRLPWGYTARRSAL